jgi:hypothetical protein
MTATGDVATAAAELELCWPARAWLIEVGQSALAQRSGGSRDALRSLLGAAICERALRPSAGAYPSAGLRLLARGVCLRLAADQETGAFQPLDHDPKLLLLCGRVLSASEAPSPVLNGYARALASAVRRARAGDFAGERLLLAGMGHLNASARPSAWSGPVSFDDLVTAGLPRIRAVCGQIAASTGYGTTAASMAPADRAALRDALSAVLLQVLRQHDLVAGGLLLRSLGYLGAWRDRSISCASSFLRAQQQPDGRFGYLAMEARQAEVAFGADPVTELYLPITVSCVWALAETLGGGFRLFGPEPPA